MNLTKNCNLCQKEKILNDFYTQKSNGKEYVNNTCKDCVKEKNRIYRLNNKEKKSQLDKEYYNKNKNSPEFIKKSKEYRDLRKDVKSLYDKQYRLSNKEKYKNYCLKNKNKISKQRHDFYIKNKENRLLYNKLWSEKNKNRRQEINTKAVIKRLNLDVKYKLRRNISRTINKYLKLNLSSKEGNSILKYLPYTINELKIHLEKQFESWMTWNNWGPYSKDIWKDEDQSTWTWQIDHIIPQSKLIYSSMEEENFKKCWALNNLRPLNSKQNLLESNNR